jgi:hypothetical protein
MNTVLYTRKLPVNNKRKIYVVNIQLQILSSNSQNPWTVLPCQPLYNITTCGTKSLTTNDHHIIATVIIANVINIILWSPKSLNSKWSPYHVNGYNKAPHTYYPKGPKIPHQEINIISANSWLFLGRFLSSEIWYARHVRSLRYLSSSGNLLSYWHFISMFSFNVSGLRLNGTRNILNLRLVR